MLPLKWKIFRVICFLHIAAVLSILGLNLFYAHNYMFSDAENIMYFLLFLFILGILLSNTIINILLLERYYPDRKPGAALDKLHIVLLILFIILVSLLTIGTFSIFFDARASENRMDPRSKLFFVLIATIAVTGLASCYFQLSLRKTIRRNYKQGFDNFLNT